MEENKKEISFEVDSWYATQPILQAKFACSVSSKSVVEQSQDYVFEKIYRNLPLSKRSRVQKCFSLPNYTFRCGSSQETMRADEKISTFKNSGRPVTNLNLNTKALELECTRLNFTYFFKKINFLANKCNKFPYFTSKLEHNCNKKPYHRKVVGSFFRIFPCWTLN